MAAGARDVAPIALAALVIGMSFGILARDAGMGVVAPIVMSLTTFAGSAQMAAAGVINDGGAVAAAVVAAILLNLRYVAIGVSVAPSLRGRRVRRLAESQLATDESWAIAAGPRAGRPRPADRRRARRCSRLERRARWPGCSAGACSAIPRPTGSTRCSPRSSSPCSPGSCASAPPAFPGAGGRADRARADGRSRPPGSRSSAAAGRAARCGRCGGHERDVADRRPRRRRHRGAQGPRAGAARRARAARPGRAGSAPRSLPALLSGLVVVQTFRRGPGAGDRPARRGRRRRRCRAAAARAAAQWCC